MPKRPLHRVCAIRKEPVGLVATANTTTTRMFLRLPRLKVVDVVRNGDVNRVAVLLAVLPVLSLVLSLIAAWVTQGNDLLLVHAVSIVSIIVMSISRKSDGTVSRR